MFTRPIVGAHLILMAAILGLLALVIFGVAAPVSKAATPGGFPLDLQVTSNAQPGKVAVGTIVTFKVTIKGTTGTKLQVGIPGPKPVYSDKKLTRPVSDLSIWTPRPLGSTPQTLIFKVRVESPPEDATGGDALWCTMVVAGPSLLKGPPAWSREDRLCYLVRL